MEKISLYESPNTKQIDRRISESNLIRQYNERKAQLLIEQVGEILKQEERSIKTMGLYSKNIQLINELKIENGRLLMQIKNVSNQNQMLKRMKRERSIDEASDLILKKRRELKEQKEEIEGLKCMQEMSVSECERQNKRDQWKMEDQQRGQQMSVSGYKTLEEIGLKDQKQHLDWINSSIQLARQAHAQESLILQNLAAFLQVLIEKLARKFQFVIPSYQNQYQELITIPKSKYQKLLNFYCQNVFFTTFNHVSSTNPLNPQNQIHSNQQIHQSSNMNENHQSSNKKTDPLQENLFIQSSDYQSFFQSFLSQQGLQVYWKKFMQTNKQDSINFKNKIKQIVEGRDNTQQNKKNLASQMCLIKRGQKKLEASLFTDSSILTQNQILSSGNAIKMAQNQIQEILFGKLEKLLIKLNFSQKQVEMFRRFDQKRKHGRILGVEDLQKLSVMMKQEQRIKQLATEYSLWVIKSINQAFAGFMDVLQLNQKGQKGRRWNESIKREINKVSQKYHNRLQEELGQSTWKYLKEASINEQKNVNGGAGNKNENKRVRLALGKGVEEMIMELIEENKTMMRKNVFFYHRRVEIKE